MRKFKVAQILSSRAVKRNYLHCKLKQYTVSELAKGPMLSSKHNPSK